MQILAPWAWGQQTVTQIMLKMTNTAVFLNFHDPIWTYQNLLFNLEKYIRIYQKLIKVTCQMTKTGTKE